MTTYLNKYLEMLKAENSGKAPTAGTFKILKIEFEGFEGSLGRGFLPKSVFSISRYLFR